MVARSFSMIYASNMSTDIEGGKGHVRKLQITRFMLYYMPTAMGFLRFAKRSGMMVCCGGGVERTNV
jgi:hypothetical protein